jgi:hypothetical protein
VEYIIAIGIWNRKQFDIEQVLNDSKIQVENIIKIDNILKLPSPASSYQTLKPGAALETSDLNLIHILLL